MLACDDDFRYVFKFRKQTIHFERLWRMKSSLRANLQDWLVASDLSVPTAEISANACSELVENAIKYSQEGQMVIVAIQVCRQQIVIETSNATAREHQRWLAAALAELRCAEDIQQVFIEKLRQPVAGKSHLGLVKVAFERGHL